MMDDEVFSKKGDKGNSYNLMKEKEKELIKKSLEGNKKSLEELLDPIQMQTFNLCLRFLWHRQDAEDATQEILIKIITNLGKFDHKSRLSTWAYRIAINYLINLKPTNLENKYVSFEVFAKDLDIVPNTSTYDLPDKELMEREMKTGCTLAMLQCLNRDLRIAFILGSVLGLKSTQASEIVGITPANFRKRLEISRKRIKTFLNDYCGVYNPKRACRCNPRIKQAISMGRINRLNPDFVKSGQLDLYNDEMEELNSLMGIYQNHGEFENGMNVVSQINEIIASKRIINFGKQV